MQSSGNPEAALLLLLSFFKNKWGNWASLKLSNLPKANKWWGYDLKCLGSNANILNDSIKCQKLSFSLSGDQVSSFRSFIEYDSCMNSIFPQRANTPLCLRSSAFFSALCCQYMGNAISLL